MSFHYSPRIVRDNSLVLYIDVANNRSFVGGSTNWYDLSGNNNTGTLNGLNGLPIYNNSNGGNISFDGTDDYVNLPNSTSLKPANPTLSMWIKPGITNKNQFIFDGGYYNSVNGYLLYASSANQFQFWIRNSSNNTQGVGVRTVTSTTVFDTSNWYNVTGIFDGSNVYIYVNGILENSAVMTNPINYASSTNFWIGNYASVPGAGVNFQGDVSNMLLYNRALSAAEVLQNYNAIKSRFGL